MTDKSKQELIDSRPITVLLDESFRDGIDYIKLTVVNYAGKISPENLAKMKSILNTGEAIDEAGNNIDSFSTKAAYRPKNYQSGNGLQSIYSILKELKGSINLEYDDEDEFVRIDFQIPDLISYQREKLTEDMKNP